MSPKLGMISSPADVNYYKLGQFVKYTPEAELPESFLVSPLKSVEEIPIYDQGQTSTCVAQALAAAEAQKQYVETGIYDRLSPGWIYGNRDNGNYTGEGMIPSQALKILCRDGVPSYSIFPEIGTFSYCNTLVLKRKPAMLDKAIPNKILSYVQLQSPYEVKIALMTIGVVLIGIEVYENFYNVGEDGIVDAPSGRFDGGHMMAIYGWTSDNKWIVANSWGTNWGSKGLCYMPYKYKAVKELWSVTDYQKRELISAVPAAIGLEGAFVAPIASLYEALEAEVVISTEDGKKTLVAIVPANVLSRKVTIVEDSTKILVEVI